MPSALGYAVFGRLLRGSPTACGASGQRSAYRLQGLELTAQMHTSGAAVRRVFDEQTTAAGLTGLVHKWALPDTPHFGGPNLASLPALQVILSSASRCDVADTQGATAPVVPYRADAYGCPR